MVDSNSYLNNILCDNLKELIAFSNIDELITKSIKLLKIET